MKVFNSIRLSHAFPGLLVLALLCVPQAVQAEHWRAAVGAQSGDKAHQALAFLPTEFWIHAGDTITWTQEADDIHTVTFLTATQNIPPFQAGCPGFSGGAASFDGSTCITTPPLLKGQTFAVTFPKAGNYKVICLVHNAMNGTIHVLHSNEPLPYDQDYYDQIAASQRSALLNGVNHGSLKDSDMEMSDFQMHVFSGQKHVVTGAGATNATPGGIQTASLVRFVDGTVQIHAGDTVEWGSFDPDEPHTITFGKEPADLFHPSPNVTVDADGVRHATIISTSESVHSGFIEATLIDNPGRPQNPLDHTRFRITFTHAGTYNYICSLHDNLGMKGSVVVLP